MVLVADVAALGYFGGTFAEAWLNWAVLAAAVVFWLIMLFVTELSPAVALMGFLATAGSAFAVLPAGAGYIVEAFGAGDTAYRWVFGVLAAGIVLGSFAYVRARDSFTV